MAKRKKHGWVRITVAVNLKIGTRVSCTDFTRITWSEAKVTHVGFIIGGNSVSYEIRWMPTYKIGFTALAKMPMVDFLAQEGLHTENGSFANTHYYYEVKNRPIIVIRSKI